MSIRWLTSQPRHWPRYGDGNWLVMDATEGTNCDGHQMDIPEMVDEMRATVAVPKPGIHYALTDFAQNRCPRQIIKYASPYIEWSSGDILTQSVIDGNMGGLTNWLAQNVDRLCYVAPPHFVSLPNDIYPKPERHLQTKKNCWKDTWIITEMLANWVDELDVVVFAASFLTACAIYRLHEIFEGKWLIDVGSSLDPLCEVFSRAYHKPRVRQDGKTWDQVYGY